MLDSRASQLLTNSGSTLNLVEQPRRIEIDRTFWLGPEIFKSLLWCLSVTGELWSISPFDKHARAFGSLDEGFGKSAFTISEASPDNKNDNWPPYLLSGNRHSIRGINLLNGVTKEFWRASAGDLLLSGSDEPYVGLESIERTVYFLKKREGQTYLGAHHLFNNASEEYPLLEEHVVGPFKIGDRIGVYSPTHLYLLKDRAVEAHLSFPNFKAWLGPGEFSRIQPRVCYMPFISRHDSIYIPGQRGVEQGFLYVSLQEQGASVSFCRITGDVAYAEDTEGRLLVARNGRIEIYEGSNPVTVRNDQQLSAQIPPFHDDLLTVGFIRTAGDVKALRFYANGSQRDYSLSQLSDLIGIGFLNLAGSLTFSYLRERNDRYYLGLLIWDVQ